MKLYQQKNAARELSNSSTPGNIPVFVTFTKASNMLCLPSQYVFYFMWNCHNWKCRMMYDQASLLWKKLLLVTCCPCSIYSECPKHLQIAKKGASMSVTIACERPIKGLNHQPYLLTHTGRRSNTYFLSLFWYRWCKSYSALRAFQSYLAGGNMSWKAISGRQDEPAVGVQYRELFTLTFYFRKVACLWCMYSHQGRCLLRTSCSTRDITTNLALYLVS